VEFFTPTYIKQKINRRTIYPIVPEHEIIGVRHFELTTQKDAFIKLTNKFDVIINSVSANLDYNPYIST
jgi:hypothetical protein